MVQNKALGPDWRHYQARFLASLVSALLFAAVGWWAMERGLNSASLFTAICFLGAIVYGTVSWGKCAVARHDARQARNSDFE